MMSKWRLASRFLAIVELGVCIWMLDYFYNNRNPIIWINFVEILVMAALFGEAIIAILMIFATLRDCPRLNAIRYCNFWEVTQITWVCISAPVGFLLVLAYAFVSPCARNVLTAQVMTAATTLAVVFFRCVCYLSASKFKAYLKSSVVTIST